MKITIFKNQIRKVSKKLINFECQNHISIDLKKYLS